MKNEKSQYRLFPFIIYKYHSFRYEQIYCIVHSMLYYWSIISNLSHCTKEQALSHKHLVVFFLNDGPDIKLFILVGLGPELFCLLLGPPGFNCWFSFAPVFQWCCSTP